MSAKRQVPSKNSVNIRVPMSAIRAADATTSRLFPQAPPSRSKMLTAAIFAGLAVMQREEWERFQVYAVADGAEAE